MTNILKLFIKKGLRDALLCIFLLLCAAALIAAPEQSAGAAREGLSLCFNVIIPSLFPFFVLSSLVVDLGLAACLGRAMEGVMRPLFRVNGSCAAAVVLGFIGGYPVGARTALQLYRQGMCSRHEAERLLSFCNNSGPAFILGVVGAGVFGDSRVGLLLYCTHAAASLAVGVLFRFHGNGETHSSAPQRSTITTLTLPAAFTGAISAALRSTLHICAYVVFFSVVVRLLTHWGMIRALGVLLARIGLSPPWAQRLTAGLLELTTGISSLSGAQGFSGRLSMAAFMLGWAGLSVHCQVLSFLADSGLSPRTYLAGKLLHGLIAAGCTWLLTRVIPLPEPVAGYLAGQTETIAGLDFSSTLACSLVTAAAAWLLLAVIGAAALRKKCGKTQQYRI